MKIDIFFPPPPQHNQPPLKCSDLTPGRQRALDRMSAFAAVAESLVGSIPAPAAPSADGQPPPYEETALGFKATSRGFALHCLAASPYLSEVQALLARAKLSLTASDHVDAPHVMLIDVRKYWGMLGPIRGDVVLFADGGAAVVTQALCMGCQHFEGVSLGTNVVPQIVKKTGWVSTLKWIIRLVDEDELPVPLPEAQPVSEESNAVVDAALSGTALDLTAPADTQPTPKKVKKTGIG